MYRIQQTGFSMMAALIGLALVGAAPAAAQQDPQPDQQSRAYVAHLLPLNTGVNDRPVTGKAYVLVEGDNVEVVIVSEGVESGMPHPQHIHGKLTDERAHCPTDRNDTNGDGVVDVVEGLDDYGEILVALDNQLTDGPAMQAEGFPAPQNQCGVAPYRATGSLSEIEAALAEAQPDTQPKLDLDRRVIVLHGVSADIDLPDSTQSIMNLDPHLTLPVACGELRPVACAAGRRCPDGANQPN